jgi:hypothetical protein
MDAAKTIEKMVAGGGKKGDVNLTGPKQFPGKSKHRITPVVDPSRNEQRLRPPVASSRT